jgi:hypothetical protein
MAEPRKHHYLPQFYLLGFSTDGRSIYQIEKHGLRAYTCSIRDAAAIRDYHKLDDPHFVDANATEKRLAHVEAQLARALARVIQVGVATPETHALLIQLVALLQVRVPAFKARIEAFLQQVVCSVGRPPIPEGLEDVLRMENLSIEILNWKCLEFMFNLAGERRILDILGTMKPSLLRAPGGVVFLTSDQPVARYHPTASPTDAYGTGPVDVAAEISVPLSSHTLLLLSWPTNPPNDRVATSDEVAEFNRRTVVMADSLVFAPEECRWAVETVARYGHCSAGVDLDFFDAGEKALHLARFRPVMPPGCYPNGPPN